MAVLKQAAFGFVAVMAGAFGMMLLISDLGPGETMAMRVSLTGLFFFLGGLAFGSLNRHYWPAAGLIAWGGIFASLAGVVDQQSSLWSAIVMLALTLGLALVGGFAGARLVAMVSERRSLQR
jgi:hypothetical protein